MSSMISRNLSNGIRASVKGPKLAVEHMKKISDERLRVFQKMVRFDMLEMKEAQLVKGKLAERGVHDYDTPTASTTPTTIAKENTAASPNTPVTVIRGTRGGILLLPSTPLLMRLDPAPSQQTHSNVRQEDETHSPDQYQTHSNVRQKFETHFLNQARPPSINQTQNLPMVQAHSHYILTNQLENFQPSVDCAIRTQDCDSHYQGVYLLECNQNPFIIKDIVEYGSNFRIGLEVGFMLENLLALSCLCKGHRDAILVCNGFKDFEYNSLAVPGRKLELCTVIIFKQDEEDGNGEDCGLCGGACRVFDENWTHIKGFSGNNKRELDQKLECNLYIKLHYSYLKSIVPIFDLNAHQPYRSSLFHYGNRNDGSVMIRVEFLMNVFVHYWLVENDFSQFPVVLAKSFCVAPLFRSAVEEVPPTCGLEEVVKLLDKYLRLSWVTSGDGSKNSIEYSESPQRKTPTSESSFPVANLSVIQKPLVDSGGCGYGEMIEAEIENPPWLLSFDCKDRPFSDSTTYAGNYFSYNEIGFQFQDGTSDLDVPLTELLEDVFNNPNMYYYYGWKSWGRNERFYVSNSLENRGGTLMLADLNKRIDESSQEMFDMIFNGLTIHDCDLMMNPFGISVLQSLVRKTSSEQVTMIINIATENMHLVMECCEGSEFFDRIRARGHYMERAAATEARTIAVVVMICHSNGVMQRDIKSESFLIANKKENSPLMAIGFAIAVFIKSVDGNDGAFWSKLFSLADEEQSHDGDSHGLSANIFVSMNKLSGFKKCKASDKLFLDQHRQTTICIEDSFFEMVLIQSGGVYTKAQLQKELKALCVTISCAKSKWQSVVMFRCINVGLRVQSNLMEMDTKMSHMTNKVKLDYYMSLEKDYKWRRDRVCPCLLPTPVYAEVMLIVRDQGKEVLAENVLKNGSIDIKIVQEAEDEVKKLNALKSSKMMKLVFKCGLERHLKSHLEDKVSSIGNGIDRLAIPSATKGGRSKRGGGHDNESG